VKASRAVRKIFSSVGTLVTIAGLPGLVVAYWVQGNIFSILQENITFPAWLFLLLIAYILLASVMVIELIIKEGTQGDKLISAAKTDLDCKENEELIEDYKLRIKGMLGSGCTYSQSQLYSKLKLPPFSERHYKCFQQAIGKLIDNRELIPSKHKSKYKLII